MFTHNVVQLCFKVHALKYQTFCFMQVVVVPGTSSNITPTGATAMILAGVTSGEEGDVEEEEGCGKDGEEEAERINDQVMKHSTPLYYTCTLPFSISTLSLVQSVMSYHTVE